MLNKLNATPSEKHHAYTAGRVFFRWCRSQRYLDRSPMEDLGIRSSNRSRDRVLSDRELASVLTSAREHDVLTASFRCYALLDSEEVKRRSTGMGMD